VVREPSVQDLLGPIIIELHVANAGEEKRRRGQLRERNDAD
jgi:hypothetical protein